MYTITDIAPTDAEFIALIADKIRLDYKKL